MNEPRKVAVTYRRQVSDGAYGTESAEVYLEDIVHEEDIDMDDPDGYVVTALLRQARHLVQQHLAGSDNGRIARQFADAVPVFKNDPALEPLVQKGRDFASHVASEDPF